MNFMNLGPMEMVIIGVIALVVVGPRRLPELGRMVGKWMKVVREASDEMRRGLYYEDTYRPPVKPRPTPAISVSQQAVQNTPLETGPSASSTETAPANAEEKTTSQDEPGTVKSAEYRDAYPYGQDGMD